MPGEVRSVRLVTALLLVLIFAAGVGAGAALCRWTGGHADRLPRPPLPPPWHALGLSPEQQKQAREIAEKHRPALEAVLRETFPRVRAINDQMERELRAILTPDQIKLLEQLKAAGPPPGMPPPGMGPPPPGMGPPPPL
jgi:hypothetical protein